MTTIVTVVNKFDIFKSTIEDNLFMNSIPIHVFDNTQNNITIPQRYNAFIENHMPDDDWVVFCHQDFGFQENIATLLGKLDRNVIYGPIGAAPTRQLVFIIALSRYGVERSRVGLYPRSKLLGQITQSTNKKTRKMGRYLWRPAVVDTLDCCCMIVHSSLIRKYSLRFDEYFDWHLYGEDFSLNARKEHQVVSKAVQFKCIHFSDGSIDCEFEVRLSHLKKKYRTNAFATTCYDGYKRF
jgi:hypothetical protein